jgi:hypothetical protein
MQAAGIPFDFVEDHFPSRHPLARARSIQRQDTLSVENRFPTKNDGIPMAWNTASDSLE